MAMLKAHDPKGFPTLGVGGRRAEFAQTGPRQFELMEPFYVQIEWHGRPVVVRAPKGFVTDLASVPRGLWWVFPPFGRWTEAAIVHDWLYSQGWDREESDGVLARLMERLGCGRLVVWAFWSQVRLWGWANFKKKKAQMEKSRPNPKEKAA